MSPGKPSSVYIILSFTAQSDIFFGGGDWYHVFDSLYGHDCTFTVFCVLCCTMLWFIPLLKWFCKMSEGFSLQE
jgi:hypothetical protein